MMNSQATGTTLNEVSMTTDKQVEISEIALGRESVKAGDVSKETVQTVSGMPPMVLEDYLTRNVLVQTGVLTSTDVAWANIFGSSIDPWYQFLNNPQVAAKTAGYARIRGELEVTLVVNPPANAYGAYCFSAVCEGGALYNYATTDYIVDPEANDNPYTATQDVHGVVNVSLATTVSLELPFVYPFDAIDLLNMEAPTGFLMWRLNLWAWAPIRNSLAEDAITATYKVYVRLKPGYTLSVATHQAKGKAVLKSKEATVSTGGSGASKKATGAVSGFAAKVSQAAGMVGAAVPFLEPFAGPLAVGAGLASKIADMFGFTRESDVSTPGKMVVRGMSALSHVDGEDTSDVVALMRDNATTIDPRIGGGIEEDPTALSDIFKRWTLVSTGSWESTDDVGTLLVNVPVTPGICGSTLGVRYPSTCAYVGYPFQYWRGSMEYLIYVPSSPYHRGVLQVFWDPKVSNTMTGDSTNRVSNVIFDIAVDDALQVGVGYAQVQPCKRFALVGSSVPYGDEEELNGVLRIFVHSTLQAPVTTAGVKVLVFARARNDMKFGVPANLVRWGDGTSKYPITVNMVNQAGIGDEEEEVVKTVELVGVANLDTYPVGAIAWGEDIASIRPLLQKFSQVIEATEDVDSGFTACVLPHFFPPRATNTQGSPPRPFQEMSTSWSGVTPQWTWFGWYSQMFVGIRGSARWKVIPRTTAFENTSQPGFIDVAVFPVRTFDLNNDSGNYSLGVSNPLAAGNSNAGTGSQLMSVQRIAPTLGGAEFLLPYYSDAKFQSPLLIRTAPTVSEEQATDVRWDAFAASNGNKGIGRVFYAGGPDVAPVRFRRCPAIKYYG